jgi:hypothetical protein
MPTLSRASATGTPGIASKAVVRPQAAPSAIKLGGAAATKGMLTAPEPLAAKRSRASRAEPAPRPLETTGTYRAARAPEGQTAAERAVPPATAELFDDAVDAAVDRLLDRLEVQKDAAVVEAERAADQRAAAETFYAMVTANAAQLRELMFQLSLGRTPRKWAVSCRPVVAAFLKGARQIELSELSAVLAQLDAALEHAAGEAGAHIRPETGSAIEAAYAKLSALLPQAFAVSDGSDGRRLVLLESLLLQVPAMSRRTLSKLYGAGLASLDRLSVAAAEEISAVAGIDRRLAEAVAERVQRFERERGRLDSPGARPQAHERLRSLLTRLRQLQEEFDRAELEEAAERKRVARRARATTSHELDALLADIGELSLIEELRRCAVRNKIRRLESYLEHEQASA